MNRFEYIRQFNPKRGEFRYVEKPPPINLIARGSPPGEYEILLLQQCMQSPRIVISGEVGRNAVAILRPDGKSMVMIGNSDLRTRVIADNLEVARLQPLLVGSLQK